jgi:hypothetical protein
VLDKRHALMRLRVTFCVSQSIAAQIVSAASLFIGQVYVREADGYGLVFLVFPALRQYWSRLYPTTLLEPPTLQPWFLHRLPRNHLRGTSTKMWPSVSSYTDYAGWHTGTRETQHLRTRIPIAGAFTSTIPRATIGSSFSTSLKIPRSATITSCQIDSR